MFPVEQWLASHWGWLAGGAGALGLGALFLLNPAAALKLLSSVAGWALDMVRGAIQWARNLDSHGRWRAGCIGLALAFSGAAFVAWDARQTIVVVQAECATKVGAAEAACAAVRTDAEALVTRVNREAAERIAAAAAQAKSAGAAGAAAAAEVERLREEAETFDERMEQARKNPDCDALLNVDLAAVCAL